MFKFYSVATKALVKYIKYRCIDTEPSKLQPISKKEDNYETVNR